MSIPWHDKNPYNPDTFMGSLNWDVHQWGRTQFASSYARGGLGYTAFAPTVRQAMINPWRTPLEHGSPLHIARLKEMQGKLGKNKRLDRLVDSLENPERAKPWKDLRLTAKAKKVGGTALRGAGFVATPAFIAYSGYSAAQRGGGPGEVAKAMGEEASAFAGAWLGMKAGASVGAGIGFAAGGVPGMAIGSVVGTVVGMFGGFIGGAELFSGTVGIAENLVEEHRNKRAFNWVGSTAAFDTRRAYTMRQQSLQLMNRGMMTARSTMGREAVMLHQ